MQRRLASIVLLTTSLVWIQPFALAEQTQERPKQKAAPKSKTDQASLSGCIDEQDGRYVLIEGRTRALIANLEADGFETEGFAKHVGHKVIVRGTSNPSGAEHPVFKVRSVETVSDTCAPQQR
jgi:hypothetical protein